MSRLHSWNVKAGHFFFRYRNALFPILFAAVLIFLRPQVILNPTWDRALVVLGIAVAVLGQCVRLFTIGFDYIDRGGKNKQVYASRLVQKGVYGLSRNPMYVGNLLIMAGLCMVSGVPEAYFFVIPFFSWVYWAIIAAEEDYLRTQYGPDFEAYCAQVHRFLPSWNSLSTAFSGFRYDWQKAIKKEMGTVASFSLWLILLPLWRTYFLQGPYEAKNQIHHAIFLALLVGIVYGLLMAWKKSYKWQQVFHNS